jgi:hypothetical protein
MTEAVGIDLVLRRLASAGCQPEPLGIGAWHARCPVHGVLNLLLVVTEYGDRSVTLRCRDREFEDESCSEAAMWESPGLDPRQFRPGKCQPRIFASKLPSLPERPEIGDAEISRVDPRPGAALPADGPVLS